MKRIIPAILTDKKEEFVKMAGICAGFTDYIQIDIMDGGFVPSKSITPRDFKGLKLPINSEAHLMVKNPLEWLSVFKKFGSQRLIFHFEIEADHLEIIKRIKQEGLEAGIAVNPSTGIKEFQHLIEGADFFLFMSVNPGFYGAEFIPRVLDKIKRFKHSNPDKLAGIDGGVKLDNIKQVVSSGVDYICVGSAILKSNNPREAYEEFLENLNINKRCF